MMAYVSTLNKEGKAALQACLCGTAPVMPFQTGLSYWRKAEGAEFCKAARTVGEAATVSKHFSQNVWGSGDFRAKRAELEAAYAIAMAAYKQGKVAGLTEDEVLLLAGAVPEVLELPNGRARVMRTPCGKYFDPKQLFDSKEAIEASLQPKKRAAPAASPAAGGSSSESAPASKRAKCGRKIALPAAKELDTAAA
jgi:hypothetical protein